MSTSSPLFCIPRELRDEIYTYYLYEEDGYFHDFATGRLRRSHQRPIDLSLSFTCRTIAQEMKGLALRINQVTITTGLSGQPSDNYLNHEHRGFQCLGLRSTAGRYESLLTLTCLAKMQMLLHASVCVTSTMLHGIRERYDEVGLRFVRQFRAACEEVPGWSLGTFIGGGHFIDYTEVSPPFRNALDTALTLASTDSRFDALARKAFDKDLNHPEWSTVFRRDAYDVVMDWRPPPWHIPSSDELSVLESLTTVPTTGSYRFNGEWEDARDYSTAIWYFSATAVTIQFLQRLSNYEQKVRKIIIQEDHKAVAHPAYHAEGLIPFCQRDPYLRIERRVGCWTSMCPPGWPHTVVAYRERFPHIRVINCHKILKTVIEWICETDRLAGIEMPTHSLFTLFDVRSENELQVWSLVRDAVDWQESMKFWLQTAKEESLESLSLLTDEHTLRWDPYALPCLLPSAFPRAVLSTLEGTPSVRCLGDVRHLSERKEPLTTVGLDWDLKTWEDRWRQWYGFTRLNIPGGDMKTFLRPYFSSPDL